VIIQSHSVDHVQAQPITTAHDHAADVRAVLLPICDVLVPPHWLRSFVANGGCTVLLASSAREYDDRRISDERRAGETPEQIAAFRRAVDAAAGRPVVVTVDAEPSGVQRLEHLLPPLPRRPDLEAMDDHGLHEVFTAYASAARALGIGLVLSPVVDEIRGQNPWLAGRVMAGDLEQIARVAAAYVRAVQAAGVTATAKHFPGFSDLGANPMHAVVDLTVDRGEVEVNLAPFKALVRQGVGAVMLGPTVVAAIDPARPAALSPRVVSLLREDIGFTGLIISDDLEALSTLRGRSIPQTAVDALAAGTELLLVPGGDTLNECITVIEDAVTTGRLDRQALAAAAHKVRTLAGADRDHTREDVAGIRPQQLS